MSKSSVGDGITSGNADWNFSGDVCEQFSRHVRRSIPLYDEGHDIICQLSDFFLKENSLCYELGTSVGELLYKLAAHHREKETIQFIGIDNMEAMIEKASSLNPGFPNTRFMAEDVNLFDYQKSDLIVCYYVIQFIPPHLRQELINRLYEALNWGGALIMFEKVRGPDARFQDILSSLYLDFKLKNDFTPDEIVAKSRSLKGVLEPFSTQGNLDLLARAGFVDITTVMKYLCFEGFLAIK